MNYDTEIKKIVCRKCGKKLKKYTLQDLLNGVEMCLECQPLPVKEENNG